MSKIKTLNASLLVVGTSIGAAILGLPVETAKGGFIPSILILFVNWLIMTSTALLLIELLYKFKENSNFITLSEKILGTGFKVLTFIVYIALFMSLTLAYVKGGGIFVSDLIAEISVSFGSFIFLLLFVPLIILGSNFLGVGNTILAAGLFCSFILLISLGLNTVNSSFLVHVNWKWGLLSFPMFITSFGFHSILPSLYAYLKNKNSLRCAVVVGTTITFLVYFVWQLMVIGIVPLEGEHGLKSALVSDQTAITPLKFYLKYPALETAAQIFYFTAMATSFLGVGLGLIDFLLDSFKIKNKLINRCLLGFLIYIPAFWIAQSNLRIFYLSLKYGGGFACLYLLVLLPIFLYLKSNRSFISRFF